MPLDPSLHVVTGDSVKPLILNFHCRLLGCKMGVANRMGQTNRLCNFQCRRMA